MVVVRNLDHVTIAVANAESAIEFFNLLGFEKQHVALIDEIQKKKDTELLGK